MADFFPRIEHRVLRQTMSGIAKLFERIDYLTVMLMVSPLALFLGLSWLGVTQLLVVLTGATVLLATCKLAHWGRVRREAWLIRQTRRRLIASWKIHKEIGNS